MRKNIFTTAASIAMLLLLAAVDSGASCGSSSCPIDLHTMGPASDRFSLDLSFQYIEQNRLLMGARRAHVGEIVSDHDEIRTINRVGSLQLTWFASDRLHLILAAPYVSRSHEHVDVETASLDRWNFHDRGEATLQARYRMFERQSAVPASLWITGGVKLPGSSARETGTSGESAEVTIAPRSGSTDALVGVTFESGVLRNTALEGTLGQTTLIPYFVSVIGRANGPGTAAYRRGNELQLNAGTEYPLSERVQLLAQVNARNLAKDDVGRTGEERGLTGGRFVYVSPGLQLRIGNGVLAYGLVQLPLYQHVNGLQLTSKANYLVGVRRNF